jgi:hypothetical protein
MKYQREGLEVDAEKKVTAFEILNCIHLHGQTLSTKTRMILTYASPGNPKGENCHLIGATTMLLVEQQTEF